MNSTKNWRTFLRILLLVLVLITAAEGSTTIYGRARRRRHCVIPRGREYTGATIRRRYGYGRDLDPLLPGNRVKPNTEIVVVCETVGDMILDYHTRTCRYGQWYKGFPKCKKNKTVTRPKPTHNKPRTHCTYRDDIPRARPSNTMVTNSRYPHGTTISYVCNRGYRLLGNRKRRCKSGIWTPVRFRCVPSKATKTTTKMPTTTAATRTTKKKTQSVIRRPTGFRPSFCKFPIHARRAQFRNRTTGRLIRSPYARNKQRVEQTLTCRFPNQKLRRKITCVKGRWKPALLQCPGARAPRRRPERSYASCLLPDDDVAMYRDGGHSYRHPLNSVDHRQTVVQRCYQDSNDSRSGDAAVHTSVCDDGRWLPPFPNCTATDMSSMPNNNSDATNNDHAETLETKDYIHMQQPSEPMKKMANGTIDGNSQDDHGSEMINGTINGSTQYVPGPKMIDGAVDDQVFSNITVATEVDSRNPEHVTHMSVDVTNITANKVVESNGTNISTSSHNIHIMNISVLANHTDIETEPVDRSNNSISETDPHSIGTEATASESTAGLVNSTIPPAGTVDEAPSGAKQILKERMCKFPSVNITRSPDKDEYSADEVVKLYHCRQNLVRVGSTRMRCQHDGTWHGDVDCLPYCENGVDEIQETSYNYIDSSTIEHKLVPTRLDSTDECFRLCSLHEEFVCRAIRVNINRRNKTVCMLLARVADSTLAEGFLVEGADSGTKYRIYNRNCNDKCQVPDLEGVIFRNQDGVPMITGQTIFPGTTLGVTCKYLSMKSNVASVTCMSGIWNADDVACFA